MKDYFSRREKMAQPVDHSGDGESSLKLLYGISRELASALDLSTLLTRILHLSTNNLEASSGSIIVLDENRQPIDSAMIQGTTLHKGTNKRLGASLNDGLAGWVVHNRQAALVTDTSKDERWARRPLDRQGAPMSVICAPMLVGEDLVGVMTMSHAIAGFFTQAHLDLLQSISDQAAIAALNARLYDTSQRKAEVMQALFESASYINESLELEDVLNRILDQILYGLKVEAVSLALIDSATNELVFRAATGINPDKIIGERIKKGEGIAGWVIEKGQAVIVADAYNDPRFFAKQDQITGFNTRAIAAAPIISRGQVIGVLEALNPQKPFNQDALSVLQGIGTLAGTAITHARLFREVDHARQRFRELFEDSVAPILITDQDGKILEANQQAKDIGGFSERTWLTLNIRYFHRVNWQTLGQQLSQLQNGATVSYESSMYTRYGHEVPVEVSVRRISNNGEPQLQWILLDITERKDMDRLRVDLMQMVYHDLRSPLANVLSSLNLIGSMDPVQDDQTINSIVEIAIRSTERVQRLASSLLDTSMMQAGQKIGSMAPVDLSGVMQEAVKAITPYLENKSHQLNLDLPDEQMEVMADADIIRRVLINLLENAVKYSPDDSNITIGAEKVTGQAQVWVQDNGPGIPEEDLPTIFDKFTRSRQKDNKKVKGLGLGLAFCKLAVENHGGNIRVDSKLGEGTRFTFTLPIA